MHVKKVACFNLEIEHREIHRKRGENEVLKS